MDRKRPDEKDPLEGERNLPPEEEGAPSRLTRGTLLLLALFLFALLSAAGGAFLDLPYLTPLSMVLMVVLLILLSRGPRKGEPGEQGPPGGPSRS